MRQTMETLSKEKSTLAKLAKDCADKTKQFSGKKAASSAVECSVLISDLVLRIEEGGRQNASSTAENSGLLFNRQALSELSRETVKFALDAPQLSNVERFLTYFDKFKNWLN